jgi:hypothetical protein
METAELDYQLKTLSINSAIEVVEEKPEHCATVHVQDDSFAILNTTFKSSDGKALPVTSEASREIGQEGEKIEFPTSEVVLEIPAGSVLSDTTFFLETYVHPDFLPSVTSTEVSLSPSFHFFTSLPHYHNFTKPIQVSLPVEVPLKASDLESGWLLKLKRCESCDEVPTEWHTVLEINTKTGVVVAKSSLVQYDYTTATLLLNRFSWLAWIGEALQAVGNMIGFGFFNPTRQIDYAVFGKKIRHHRWLISIHIIHRSRVLYESLVRKLKEKDYIELKYPNTDSISLDGKVCLHMQCLEPWQLQQGSPEVHISSDRIWGSAQHSSCYHEVTVEDSSSSADTLDCTIQAIFRASGHEDPRDAVMFVISHPLQGIQPKNSSTQSVNESLSSRGLLSDNKVVHAVLKYGVCQWYSIGLELGFTGPQIEACTFEIPSPGSKLQALIERKSRECGMMETKKCLLSACEKIPQPVSGAVKRYLEGELVSSHSGSLEGRSGTWLFLLLTSFLPLLSVSGNGCSNIAGDNTV